MAINDVPADFTADVGSGAGLARCSKGFEESTEVMSPRLNSECSTHPGSLSESGSDFEGIMCEQKSSSSAFAARMPCKHVAGAGANANNFIEHLHSYLPNASCRYRSTSPRRSNMYCVVIKGDGTLFGELVKKYIPHLVCELKVHIYGTKVLTRTKPHKSNGFKFDIGFTISIATDNPGLVSEFLARKRSDIKIEHKKVHRDEFFNRDKDKAITTQYDHTGRVHRHTREHRLVAVDDDHKSVTVQ